MSKPKKGITPLRIVLSAAYFVGAIALGVALGIGDAYADQYKAVISQYFNQKTYTVIETDETNEEDTNYFPTEFTSEEELYEASSAVAEQVQAEGITLLKNNDNAMPIGADTKVSLFSVSSYNFVYGGTGSGQVRTDNADTLKSALENVNIDVNDTLWNFYEGQSSSYSRELPGMQNTTGSGSTTIRVNEVPVGLFTDDVKNSFATYNDAAIVVIARSGGEGADLVADSFDGTSDREDNNYLELTDEEIGILDLVTGETYNFEKVIVLLNVSNALQFNELSSYGDKIDSILWVGAPGQCGMAAIAETFTGDVNPSGKLPDTYVYNNFDHLSVTNRGSVAYANGGDSLTSDLSSTGGMFNAALGNFVVYQEGIYVGYRYFETRYEDVVTGRANAGEWDYSEVVAYPFGYGGSYTTFEYSNLQVADEDDDTYILSVDVKNTGSVAGKEAVQVYLQKPYTDYDEQYGVEKAAVELVAFEKTAELAAGATETVTIEVEKETFRTYDYNNEETYIVEEGTYYLAVGNGSHDALNNILAKRQYSTSNGMDYDGTATLALDLFVSETDKYSESQTTGYKITNQLEYGDPNNWEGTGGVTYVSRSDWTGTVPTERVVLNYTDAIRSAVTPVTYVDYSNSTMEMPTTGADHGYTLASIMNEPKDSEKWDLIVEQIEIDNLGALIVEGGYHTNLVEEIASPYMSSKDGPQGLNSTLTSGTSVAAQAYPCEPILAATMNKDLIRRVGELVGEDGLWFDVQGWYAPGANIHRTPYSGRNFEYFSEDPYLSGIMNSLEVEGATSKGLICYSKHFVFNDQETDRYGINTWLNEQAAREIYLRSFEYATTKANGLAYMSSFNNHGPEWVGSSYALLTEILRNEWGFEGHVITDFTIGEYMSVTEGIFAGNDLWLQNEGTGGGASGGGEGGGEMGTPPDGEGGEFGGEEMGTPPDGEGGGGGGGELQGSQGSALQTDWQEMPEIVAALQNAAKNILYTVAKCNSMNGISTTSRVKGIMTTWQKWLVTLNVFVYTGLVVGGFFVARGLWIRRNIKKDAATAEEVPTEEKTE